MAPKNLKEKIKLSEKLVDKYLKESALDVVNTGNMLVNTATGVAKDATDLYKWTAEKLRKRKEQQMLARQKKEKEQKNKNIS